MPTKINFFPNFFFAFCLTVGRFTSVFKDFKLFLRRKTVEIKVFLHFLLVDRRLQIGPGSVQIHTDPDPRSPKFYQYKLGYKSDPEDCFH